MLRYLKYLLFLQGKQMITNISEFSVNTPNTTEHVGVISNSAQLHQLLNNTTPIDKIEIMFSEREIKDSDIVLLVNYLQTEIGKKIKVLYLMSSQLNNQQAKQLIEILISSGCAIEKLSLWENSLSGDLSFLSNIKQLHNSLKLLNLADNDLSNNVEYIIEIINNCPLLEALDLGNCCLSDSDVEKLCLALKTHPNLTKLSLDHNKKLTHKSIEYIEDLIQHKQTLHVNLSGIPNRPIISRCVIS